MAEPDGTWGPGTGVRTDRPTPARMYDYYLGGKDNFPADREAAEQHMAAIGRDTCRRTMRQNRDFLQRVVRYLAQQGIDQFLDLGAGLPTQGNVHEVAQAVNPDAHVVYVDVDPIVLAHGRALLADNRTTTVITADMTDPAQVLERAAATGLLDLARPTAVLLFAVLHFVADDDLAARSVAAYRDALVPGGHLALSHATAPPTAADRAGRATDAYSGVQQGFRFRTPAEVAAFFGDLELVDPGVVAMQRWRPDPGPVLDTGWGTGGVGRR